MSVDDKFACLATCPHCEKQLSLTSAVLGEQMLTLRLEWAGELMQAKTVAGTIDGTRKLLEATAKEMGAVAQVHIRRIEQSGKALEVDFLVMTKDAKPRKLL